MRPEGTWISPPFGFGTLGNELRGEDKNPATRQYQFSEEEKKRYAEDPAYHLAFRQNIEAEINTSGYPSRVVVGKDD
jgi:hypothetical protein